MAKKSNLKSVRLSDEVMEYIINFEGEGFNQKFENLVLFCMKEEASKRKKIAYLDEKIADRQKLMDKIDRLQIETDRVYRLATAAQDSVQDLAKYVRFMSTNCNKQKETLQRPL